MTNQLFLCVGALSSIGAYATTLLSNSEGVPMLPALALGTLGAGLVGAMMSWISVRRSLDVIFIGIVTLVICSPSATCWSAIKGSPEETPGLS